MDLEESNLTPKGTLPTPPVLPWREFADWIRMADDHNTVWVRIPRHPATQSTIIRPGIPRTSGRLFHSHPAGQSERSDAGMALLV